LYLRFDVKGDDDMAGVTEDDIVNRICKDCIIALRWNHKPPVTVVLPTPSSTQTSNLANTNILGVANTKTANTGISNTSINSTDQRAMPATVIQKSTLQYQTLNEPGVWKDVPPIESQISISSSSGSILKLSNTASLANVSMSSNGTLRLADVAQYIENT
jgi:hypothetical protein